MVESIRIEASERAPRVDFDAEQGRVVVEGESYPEDAAAFYGPIIEALRDYLEGGSRALTVELKLIYFNSSSAKALMIIFQLLEAHAEQGQSVTVRWHYHCDDETMEEFGEDFQEDFESARFELVAT